MKKIRVFAPATIANMGCGFDVMGMALEEVGDVLEVAVADGYGLQIENHSGVDLPAAAEKNVVTPAVLSFLDAYGEKKEVYVRIDKKILPGSGIGSSAASSAAVVFALNELLGQPFSRKELVTFAMEGEKLISGSPHADNVAPALLGGIILVRGYTPLDLISLPVPDAFYCTVVHPHIMVSTKIAREVLKKEIPLAVAVEQWGNVGGLVAGLMMGDMALVGRSMKDVVAEPCRKHFIPLYDELKIAVAGTGALAMNISGAGPAVFALSDVREKAAEIGQVMQKHFDSLGICADVYVSKVGRQGTKVIG